MSTRVSSTKKRVTVIVVAAALVVVGGGAAYAYWTSTGTGSGSATTGNSVVFSVVVDPYTDTPLTPGGPPRSVSFTVTNPSSGVQNLRNVTVEVKTPTGAAWTSVPGCSSADYTVGTPVIAGLPNDPDGISIAPAGSVAGIVSITMDDTGLNQDACKNAAVPLYLVAT